jgi:hypothetical protein
MSVHDGAFKSTVNVKKDKSEELGQHPDGGDVLLWAGFRVSTTFVVRAVIISLDYT